MKHKGKCVALNKRKLGSEKESIAEAYLKDQGYIIVEKNYFCPAGEIDLIAKDGSYLVFVEVKYRKDTKYGYPFEAVNGSKIHSILSSSRHYLYHHQIAFTTPIRYDVVSILNNEIHLIQNAFSF